MLPKKPLFFLLSLSALSLSGLGTNRAASKCPSPSAKCHVLTQSTFVVGVHGGMEWLNTYRDFSTTHVPTNVVVAHALNRKRASKSGVLGTSFGYQQHAPCYFWGVEGLVQMTNNRNTIKDSDSDDTSHLRKTLSLGIIGRFGIPLSGVSPYVFTGLELSRF